MKQPDLPSVQEQHYGEKAKQMADKHANRENTAPSTSTKKQRVMRCYRRKPTPQVRPALVELSNHRRHWTCKLFRL